MIARVSSYAAQTADSFASESTGLMTLGVLQVLEGAPEVGRELIRLAKRSQRIAARLRLIAAAGGEAHA